MYQKNTKQYYPRFPMDERKENTKFLVVIRRKMGCKTYIFKVI